MDFTIAVKLQSSLSISIGIAVKFYGVTGTEFMLTASAYMTTEAHSLPFIYDDWIKFGIAFKSFRAGIEVTFEAFSRTLYTIDFPFITLPTITTVLPLEKGCDADKNAISKFNIATTPGVNFLENK
jgi:hypothetical protein